MTFSITIKKTRYCCPSIIYAECFKQALYAECRYAGCHYALCHCAKFTTREEYSSYLFLAPNTQAEHYSSVPTLSYEPKITKDWLLQLWVIF
jgi:hypothetical protein